MVAGLRIIQTSLICLWDEMLSLVGANLVWFLASLPFFAFFWLALPRPWAVALTSLIVLVPNPLTNGVHLIASKVVRQETPEFDLAWKGLSRNLGKALLVFFIDSAFLAIIAVNLVFYLSSTNGLARFIGLVWLGVLVMWLGMQVYLHPFLIRQPQKTTLGLFRDSFFLVVASPIFTMTVVACVLMTILFSMLMGLPVPLLMMAIVALLEQKAMAVMAEKYLGKEVGHNGAAR